MKKIKVRNILLVLACICFMFLIATGAWKLYAAASANKNIPQISGQTEMLLDEGYLDTQTSAYVIKGKDVKVSIAKDTTNGKAEWDNKTKKLLIKSGLTSNAAVTLKASNGTETYDTMLTLYISVGKNPGISGPTEGLLDVGYESTSSLPFTVCGKGVKVSIEDVNHTGLITWNEATKELDIAAGLDIGTYKVILTASNGNPSLDCTWEYILSVDKYCNVKGSFDYTSSPVINDVVTVKVGIYQAKVDQETKTYEVVVPTGTYEIVLLSNKFQSVKMADMEIGADKNIPKATFTRPNMEPTGDFAYGADGHDYGVWNGKSIALSDVEATDGFVFTATMKPYFGASFRGALGITINGETFYIQPHYHHGEDIKYNHTNIRVSTKLNHVYTDTEGVGRTNQLTEDMSAPCTMKVVYLDGNYYVFLAVEGSDKEPQVLWFNEERLDLSTDFFKKGTRTLQLAAYYDFLVFYDDVSYQLGNSAAKKALEGIKLCTVTGSYEYASGEYSNSVLENPKDKVTVKVGDYVAKVDTKTRTYEVVVPTGTYDVVYSSDLFRNIKVSDVKITDDTELSKEIFDYSRLTPESDFGYGSDGYDYAMWGAKPRTVTETDEGFVVNVSMRPYFAWNYHRGAVGISSNGKTFYIEPGYLTTWNAGNGVTLWVDEKLDNDVATGKPIMTTNQTTSAATDLCTMQIVYSEGTYYVSLWVEGCENEPQVMILNEETTGLSADYFAAGKKTIQLAALDNNVVYYDRLSYRLGNEAAKEALAGIKLCKVTGTYEYTSGQYENGKLTNAGDTVTVKVGNLTANVDPATQTYEVTVPKGVYSVRYSSELFRDGEI